MQIQRVKYIREAGELQNDVLYFSEKFSLAIHLCACGCREQTVTPIREPGDERGWTLTEGSNGPTLYPSIGNQKMPCGSHYWVTDGKIVWCSDSKTIPSHAANV